MIRSVFTTINNNRLLLTLRLLSPSKSKNNISNIRKLLLTNTYTTSSTNTRFISSIIMSSTTGNSNNSSSSIKSKYHETGTNLLEQPVNEVKEWINTFDTVLTDCDGVLWLYSEAIDGASNVVNKLKELNKKVYFITNNSTKTRKEFAEKANNLQFYMKEDEILSTAYATAMYLKNRNFNKKVYIIGSMGIAKELKSVGIEYCDNCIGPDIINGTLQQFLSNDFKQEHNVGAVIIGFDEHISFAKMTKAASYLNDTNCLFIATNTDERFPMEHYVIPGTGSIVKAIETCAERNAIVIGKPNTFMCEDLIKNNIIVPERTLMIGDRCNTDILLGKNCGFQTLLVGTGIHNLCDIDKWKSNEATDEDKKLIPDVYLPKLGDLMQYL